MQYCSDNQENLLAVLNEPVVDIYDNKIVTGWALKWQTNVLQCDLEIERLCLVFKMKLGESTVVTFHVLVF